MLIGIQRFKKITSTLSQIIILIYYHNHFQSIIENNINYRTVDPLLVYQ